MLLLDRILTHIVNHISNTPYHLQYLYCQGGYVFGAKANLITCVAEIFLSAGQKGPDLTESDPTGTVSGSERIRIPPTQYELRCPSSLPAIPENAVDTEIRMREGIFQCTQLWDTEQIKESSIRARSLESLMERKNLL
jgi:hypothetical protein